MNDGYAAWDSSSPLDVQPQQEGEWPTRLLLRVLDYLLEHPACRGCVSLKRAEIVGDGLRLIYGCVWKAGTFGLAIGPELVLPDVGFTSTSGHSASLGDSEPDAVAFDVAVLLLGDPLRTSDIREVDECGINWLDVGTDK